MFSFQNIFGFTVDGISEFVQSTSNINKTFLLSLKNEIMSILIVLAIYAYVPTWKYVCMCPSISSSGYSLYVPHIYNMRDILSHLPFLYAHTHFTPSKKSTQTRVLLIFKTLYCTFLLLVVW